MRRTLVLGASLALALAAPAGCSKKNAVDLEEDFKKPPQPQEPVTIANAMGACDDLEQCQRECDAGAADRCRRLGVTSEFAKDGGKDDARATAYYEQSCAMGNSQGCVASGRMYEFAHGVAKDDAKAAGFYEKACTIGDQVGCANLGIVVEAGRGVKQDLGRARELYASACKAGAGLACDRLRRLTAADGG